MTCVRPGCAGTYGAEGFCDECGLKAPTGTPASTGASVPAPAGASAPASTGAGSDPVSVATSGGTYGTAWSGTGPTTVASRSSRGSGRGQLGAGLIDMPRVPRADPATVVMADPKVSESRRYCSACDQPVGRGRDGRPGLDEGFCQHCRTRFSFLPRLHGGDVVNDRYEVLGCLAYGGLGWIYLARDKNIGDEVAERWVVLKGLINTADADAMAAAVTERRYLVEVDHPNIVQIYDFVQHPDPKTGDPVSYIVMEYVGGSSLRDLLLARRGPTGRPEPMPLPEVLAYGLEILPAIGYLHSHGLLFCDFKPDNVIHSEEQLKLIDLGAVRRIDDQLSAVYGTPGYQAPEVAQVGPSIASDLYTVGRTLAVLSFDFRGFSTTYAERLPERDDVPVLVAHESYYRWLVRATHRDPYRRFESAEEMREQLHGVLREVLSATDGIARPATSTLFTPERRAFGTDAGDVDGTPSGTVPAAPAVLSALPLPAVDPHDPGASYLATIGAMLDPEALLAALKAAPARSPEVSLRLARALIERGDPAGAQTELDALTVAHPYDWRIDWHRGLAALAAGQPGPARSAFDAVYSALPGEPAAKLAAAVAAEYNLDKPAAGTSYERVWRTDRGFVSAAFGLARIRFDSGDRAGAVEVLDQVPPSSIYHLAAQVAAVRVRLGDAPTTLAEPDLLDASARLERLELDVERQARLSIEMIHKALHWVLASNRPAQPPVPAVAASPGTASGSTLDKRVLGHAMTERGLRLGLERSYRVLAKLSHDKQTRASLVDMANSVRPRTLI